MILFVWLLKTHLVHIINSPQDCCDSCHVDMVMAVVSCHRFVGNHRFAGSCTEACSSWVSAEVSACKLSVDRFRSAMANDSYHHCSLNRSNASSVTYDAAAVAAVGVCSDEVVSDPDANCDAHNLELNYYYG